MLIERPIELKRLDPSARPLVDDPRFLTANAQPDFAPFVKDFDRRVLLNALNALIDESLARFEDPVASDAWLAPRLYAALRLTPREAADRSIWEYLALVAYPDYVRWRWTPRTAKRNFNKDNFMGSLNQQALSRLWWSAELLRNGKDYSAVRTAHSLQDITSTLLALDLAHHRALAIVSVQYADEARKSGRMSGRDAVNKVIAKKLRAAMMTKSIDEIAPMPILADPVTVQSWIGTIVDPRDVLLPDDDEVPAPDDTVISSATLDAVRRLLETIAPLPAVVDHPSVREAERRATTADPGEPWTADRFYNALRDRQGETAVSIFRKIDDWVQRQPRLATHFGEGNVNGSLQIIYKGNDTSRYRTGEDAVIVTLWTYGRVAINVDYLMHHPPFVSEEEVRQHLRDLLTTGSSITIQQDGGDKRLIIEWSELVEQRNMDALLSAMSWIVDGLAAPLGETVRV